MTWQDELRRLDEELAAGRLSAEEYRQLRDALLGAAQGGGTAHDGGTSQGGGIPQGGGIAQEVGAAGPGADEDRTERSPFPPPFKWDQSPAERTQVIPPVPPAAGSGGVAAGGVSSGGIASGGIASGATASGSEATQVVPATGDDAERTQVVGGQGRGQGPGNGPQAGDADRTQVVHGARHPAPPGRPEQLFPNYGGPPPAGVGQAAPPWQAMPSNAPPWAGSDLPPQTDLPPAWLRQGPEDFAAEPGRSGAFKVLTIVGAVVLLAGISVGAYFLFRPSPSGVAAGPTSTTSTVSAQSAATTTPQPTTTTEPPGPPIADLPGKSRDTSAIRAFADVEALQYLTADEIGAYKAGGSGESRMGFARDGDVEIIVLVIKQQDAVAAKKVRDDLGALQQSYGLAPRDIGPDVLAGATDAPGAGPLRRAHYASDSYTVRVQVKGTNAARVDQVFTEIVGAQLDELPADA